MIFRGTTPTISIEVADDTGQLLDLSTYTNYFSISDGMVIINLENDRMTFNADKSIDMTLTQTETLSLHTNQLEFQLRAIKDGTAIATLIATGTLKDILKEGKIDEADS